MVTRLNCGLLACPVIISEPIVERSNHQRDPKKSRKHSLKLFVRITEKISSKFSMIIERTLSSRVIETLFPW